MAKKKKVKTKAKRLATFGLGSIVLIVVISITLFNVLSDIAKKYNEKKELEEKLVALKEKEVELENDVNKLKDPEYLARYAREKYFYSKDGEYVIRIPEDDETEWKKAKIGAKIKVSSLQRWNNSPFFVSKCL